MRCPEPDDPSTSLFNKLFKELSYSGSQANHQIEHITDLLRLLFFFFRSTSSLFSHKTQSNQTVLPTDASFHPPVYVLDTSSLIPGTLTQIDYPSLSILAQQSPALAMMILQVASL